MKTLTPFNLFFVWSGMTVGYFVYAIFFDNDDKRFRRAVGNSIVVGVGYLTLWFSL